jgi:hypothetical protein
MDALTTANILLSWSKLGIKDEMLMQHMASHMKEKRDFFFEVQTH